MNKQIETMTLEQVEERFNGKLCFAVSEGDVEIDLKCCNIFYDTNLNQLSIFNFFGEIDFDAGNIEGIHTDGNSVTVEFGNFTIEISEMSMDTIKSWENESNIKLLPIEQ